MTTSHLNTVLFFGLLIVTMSCSVLKKSEGEIIRGDYKVVKTEKLNEGTSQLVCIVYDKKNNTPISQCFSTSK